MHKDRASAEGCPRGTLGYLGLPSAAPRPRHRPPAASSCSRFQLQWRAGPRVPLLSLQGALPRALQVNSSGQVRKSVVSSCVSTGGPNTAPRVCKSKYKTAICLVSRERKAVQSGAFEFGELASFPCRGAARSGEGVTALEAAKAARAEANRGTAITSGRALPTRAFREAH